MIDDVRVQPVQPIDHRLRSQPFQVAASLVPAVVRRVLQAPLAQHEWLYSVGVTLLALRGRVVAWGWGGGSKVGFGCFYTHTSIIHHPSGDPGTFHRISATWIDRLIHSCTRMHHGEKPFVIWMETNQLPKDQQRRFDCTFLHRGCIVFHQRIPKVSYHPGTTVPREQVHNREGVNQRRWWERHGWMRCDHSGSQQENLQPIVSSRALHLVVRAPICGTRVTSCDSVDAQQLAATVSSVPGDETHAPASSGNGRLSCCAHNRSIAVCVVHIAKHIRWHHDVSPVRLGLRGRGGWPQQ